MAEIEEKLKVMEVKEESEKAGLKLNIQKTKIMTSGPIISWQIDGETMETETDFIFFFFFLILNFYIFQTYKKVAKAEQKYSLHLYSN